MENVLNDEQAVLYSHYLYALQRRRLIVEKITEKLVAEFIMKNPINKESGSLD